MKFKVKDPMLLPLRDPKKRELELKLLAEFEKAGKINRVDAKPVDNKEVTWGGADERLEEIGTDDGNFRVMPLSELDANKPRGDRD